MARKKQTPKGMREALEEALVDDPDDLASHMAYADWLSEQDDSKDRVRGEFIQIHPTAIPGDDKLRLDRTLLGIG